MQKDAPWSFGYFPTSAAAFHQWVHNGKPTQIVRNHIQYLRLDPATRVGRVKEWNKPIYWPLFILAALLGSLVVPAVILHRRRRAHDRPYCAGVLEMIRYLLRRIGYGFLILIGVNLLTFVLFFTVNTPDDMARLNIGGKRVTAEAIESWKKFHGYDKPLLWNESAEGAKKRRKPFFGSTAPE